MTNCSIYNDAAGRLLLREGTGFLLNQCVTVELIMREDGVNNRSIMSILHNNYIYLILSRTVIVKGVKLSDSFI